MDKSIHHTPAPPRKTASRDLPHNKVFRILWKSLIALRDYHLLEKAGRLWRLFTSGNLTGPDKALLVGAVLYWFVSADVIPDTIPIVGRLDDILVIGGVLAYFERKTRPDR